MARFEQAVDTDVDELAGSVRAKARSVSSIALSQISGLLDPGHRLALRDFLTQPGLFYNVQLSM